MIEKFLYLLQRMKIFQNSRWGWIPISCAWWRAFPNYLHFFKYVTIVPLQSSWFWWYSYKSIHGELKTAGDVLGRCEQQQGKSYIGTSGISTSPASWKYDLVFRKYVSKPVLLLTLHLTKIIQAVHYWEYLPAAVWRVHVVKSAL